MDGQKYYVEVRTPNYYKDDGYRAHALEAGRRQMGNQLYEILWTMRLPAVVDIEEEDVTNQYRTDYERYDNILRITATVTPVQHQHITMPVFDDGFSYEMIREYSKNPIKKAAQKVTNWLTRILK